MKLSKPIVGSLILIAVFGVSAPLFAGTRVGVGVSVGYPRHRALVVRGPRVGFGFHTRVGVAARTVNVGRVDFDVKPVGSKVYVDGAFLGVAKDVNGSFWGPRASFRSGTHRVRVVAPDGQVVTRRIYVMPARKVTFNLTF